MTPLAIISLDSVRADHFTAQYMPETAALGGWRLDQVVVGGSWTVPSHTCLLTGQGPWRHQWRGVPPRRVRAQIKPGTILGALQERGYETAAWCADVLRCCRPEGEVWGGPGEDGVTADGQLDSILDWLQGREHYALFLHYWSTHYPYGLSRTVHEVPMPLYRDLEAQRAYRARIAAVDRDVACIARQVLSARGIVLVTSDHGDDWGEGHPAGERHFNYPTMHCAGFRDEAIVTRAWVLGCGEGRVTCQLRNYDLAPTLWQIMFRDRMPAADGRPCLGATRDRWAECWSTEWGIKLLTLRLNEERRGTKLLACGQTRYLGCTEQEFAAMYTEAQAEHRPGIDEFEAGLAEDQMLERLRALGYVE